VDNFEAAFSNESLWNSVDENWRKGVEQIYLNLFSILKEYKFEQIDSMGKEFNSDYHESVGIIPVENKEEDNIVKEVIQKGYKKNGKILKPERVKVGQYEE